MNNKNETINRIVEYIQKIDECIGILKKKDCVSGKIIFEGITSEGKKISLDEHIKIIFKDIITFKNIQKRLDK